MSGIPGTFTDLGSAEWGFARAKQEEGNLRTWLLQSMLEAKVQHIYIVSIHVGLLVWPAFRDPLIASELLRLSDDSTARRELSAALHEVVESLAGDGAYQWAAAAMVECVDT